jgi:hypothetical protein
VRGRDLRLRLIECRAIVTVIDAGDHIAGLDMLVVGDGDGGQVAGHFRGERGLPRGDEGIVGGLKTSGVVQVEIAAAQGKGEEHRTDGGHNGAAAQEVGPVPFAGQRLSCFRLNE